MGGGADEDGFDSKGFLKSYMKGCDYLGELLQKPSMRGKEFLSWIVRKEYTLTKVESNLKNEE